MKILNFYDPQNTWVESLLRFRWDGNEFDRQAVFCRDFYKIDGCNKTPEMFPIKGKNAFEKRQNLFGFLRSTINLEEQYDRINFFMHGGKYNLNRKMITMDKRNRKGDIVRRGNIGKLAEKIKSVASPGCKIVLYSCWTGAKEDGVAAELSKLTGLYVIAHTRRGHTTKNPRKILHSYPRSGFKLWPQHGGIRALKKCLWSSDSAPFEFVEDVFSGGN